MNAAGNARSRFRSTFPKSMSNLNFFFSSWMIPADFSKRNSSPLRFPCIENGMEWLNINENRLS